MRKYNDHIISFDPKLFLRACYIILLCFNSSLKLTAQVKPEPEYQLKAVFLFNFTRFIDWPATAFNSNKDPFVIGILGSDPFGTYLDDAVSGESIDHHPISIKRYKDAKEIDNCQVLFINSRSPDSIINILETINDRHILTVSDANNFARIGGIIGFFTEENKIRMQINNDAARKAQLSISSKLLSVAQVL